MHFALADQTGPAVVRLVRRLDGMPLAIELAVCEMPASAAASCCPGSPACIFLKSPVSQQYLMSGSCAKAGKPEWLAV
jgi:hypothetical protein